MPPLRRRARGRGPRLMGVPRVGRCQGDMAPLAERRSGGHPPPGTAGPVAVQRASFPSGWRRGWTGTFSTSSRNAYMACTLRSSLPAWQPARGTKRATGTPAFQTSRARGPAIPTPGTTSLASCRGTPSATHRGSGPGRRRTSDGARTSSTTPSGGPGRLPGCRGRRRSPRQSWPWIMRRLWGERS